MEKYLFLDHDGVICLDTEWGGRYSGEGNGMFDNFNKEAVDVLNKVIEKTGCNIIISSDWRTCCDIKEMCQVYSNGGIQADPYDYTPKLPGKMSQLEGRRVIEIKSWLANSANAPFTFCVVDDMDMRGGFPYNFVWCNTPLGIKEPGLADRIIAMLDSDPRTHGAPMDHEGEE